MSINPVTNTDTMITNVGNFLYYQNHINIDVFKQILKLAENPILIKKDNPVECQEMKMVKHMNRNHKVEQSGKCKRNLKSREVLKDSSFWDKQIYEMLRILTEKGINIYNLVVNGKSVKYQSGLLWPKRSIKVSFLNRVLNFLDSSKFKFRKANFENQETEFLPKNFVLSNNIYRGGIQKIHIIATDDFYLGSPFNFYNFINYEMLNPKFSLIQ